MTEFPSILQDGGTRNFEQKMNGDFSLPVGSIPDHSLTFPVIVEFKSGFEVESSELTFELGKESRGALVKNVTYNL